MILKDFSRIENAVDLNLLKNTHIVGVGAGGAYCLYDSLARFGVGKLTVLDFDVVEEANIVRQGFETHQIDKLKVEALGDHLREVNAGMEYNGITKNFLDMNQKELDAIFKDCDVMLFLTDSFEAQAYGNRLAIHYNKPAIWAGYYERSRCAEIVFTIPNVTPACFRCGVSSRYEAQAAANEEIRATSNCNTIFHSQLLDAYVGMILMAILHRGTEGYEYSNWFPAPWSRNLLQLKVHPSYGTQEGSLFDRVFSETEGRTPNFNAVWQKLEVEHPPKYSPCPDCRGKGLLN